MYARSTSVWGNPESIDEGLAYVRDEVLPRVRSMSGCIGLSMLVSRDRGRCIVTTAWEDEPAMQDSDEGVRSLRERAGAIFGGDPVVTNWEIAVLHRERPAPQGACVRVSWTRVNPAHVDGALDSYRLTLLPKLEELPGFVSASLLLDRPTGRAASAVTYDSRESLVAANGTASALREEFARRAGLEVLEVADFDLVLAHLRVPETV